MITTCIMIGINLSVQFEALSYAYPKLVVYINKEFLAFRDTWATSKSGSMSKTAPKERTSGMTRALGLKIVGVQFCFPFNGAVPLLEEIAVFQVGGVSKDLGQIIDKKKS
ncbi:hypothetical protein NC651_011802 [Populus alba x Populus x berolinensis]|nr:hypothetical protein NC651_011802 [Populus alba x Populus x berolinensis]